MSEEQKNNYTNIALCSDGTGNRGGVTRGTNVWRTYKAIDTDCESPRQIAFYDDGVGTEDNKIIKVLGGALGWGISRNIRQIYTFLVKNYTEESLNRIYLFGFSRGAYTVRALAGFISLVGVIDQARVSSDKELDKLVKKSWRLYRRIHRKQDKLNRHRGILNHWNAKKEQKVEDLEQLVVASSKDTSDESKEQKEQSTNQQEALQKEIDALDSRINKANKKIKKILGKVERFRNEWCIEVLDASQDIPQQGTRFTIQSIGVWDTVDAVGLPVDELADAWDKIVPFKFPDLGLGKKIRSAYHAIALDDERHSFHPVLWNHDHRLQQVWFAGVHSNVGGGYPKDGMAYVSLNWILEKVKLLSGSVQNEASEEPEQEAESTTKASLPAVTERPGLIFYEDKLREYEIAENIHDKLYNSRAGLASYYRYKQRDVKELCKEAEIEPEIHESVLTRIARSDFSYFPSNIPDNATIYNTAQTDESKLDNKMVSINSSLFHGLARAAGLNWIRRFVYFLFLISTLLVLVAGLSLAEPYARECSTGDYCNVIVENSLKLLGWAIPVIPDSWVNGFLVNQEVFGIIVILFLVLFSVRYLLRRQSQHLAAQAWRMEFPLGNGTTNGPYFDDGWIAAMRKHNPLQPLWNFFIKKIFPWITVLVVFYVGATLLINKVIYTDRLILNSCVDESVTPTPLLEGRTETIDLSLTSLCNSSPLALEGGQNYAIWVDLAPQGQPVQWLDSSISAGPEGFDEGFSRIGNSLFLLWALPMRRSIGERWFRLMGSVLYQDGDSQAEANDIYDFDIGSGVEHITIPYSGRAIFYVNDAICVYCSIFGGDPQYFYQNNRPKDSPAARIRVRHLPHAALR